MSKNGPYIEKESLHPGRHRPRLCSSRRWSYLFKRSHARSARFLEGRTVFRHVDLRSTMDLPNHTWFFPIIRRPGRLATASILEPHAPDDRHSESRPRGCRGDRSQSQVDHSARNFPQQGSEIENVEAFTSVSRRGPRIIARVFHFSFASKNG